jgi:hypothetical protein
LAGFLAGLVFLGRLGLGGRALGRLCATLGLPSRFRLLGLILLRLLGFAQALDALPDPGDRRLAVLEALHRRYARQAVPDGYQALGGPTGDQFRQFLLAGEGIERSGGCGGSLLCGAKRRDVVVVVNRKRRHNRSPWCHAYRGHHIDHSEVLEKQGNCAVNRRWRRGGDEEPADHRRWQ